MFIKPNNKLGCLFTYTCGQEVYKGAIFNHFRLIDQMHTGPKSFTVKETLLVIARNACHQS